MKVSELDQLIENIISKEVKKLISEENGGQYEVYHITCEGEPLATFKTEGEAKEELPKYKSSHKGELIIEKGVYESHGDMLDKLDEMGQQLEEKENTNMENQETMEGNAFAAAVLKAKEEGNDTFEFDGEMHNVEECWKQLEEEETWEEEQDEQYAMDEDDMCSECGDGYMEEELHGNQEKIDANHDGEISADDFKLLRKDVQEGMCEKCGKEVCECGNGYMEEEDNSSVGDIQNVTSLSELRDFKRNCGMNCKIYRKGMMTVTLENYDELMAYHFDVVSDFDGATSNNPDLEFSHEEEIDEFDPEMFNESKKNKKTLRLSESQLVELIQKMVNESSIPTATTKAQGESKKENDENLSNVDKKMKDYLSIPGNNNNEFPKQNQKGENVKVNPTSEEAEMIDDEKGRGLENLNYDHEPSSRFKERLKKALEGDSTMGNGQDAANVVKSDLSKKIEKEVKRKEEAKKEEPLYKKEPVPVKTMNESDNKKSPLLMEEIAKMKSLSSYNKKTQ